MTKANPVWLGITNVAVLRVDASHYVASIETGHVFVPKTPETLTYDADGNLLSDGRWTYTWDAENRLLRVQSRSDTPQTWWRLVEWQYDALGRRMRQITSDISSGTWQVTEDLKIISDPMLFGRHIVGLNATNNSLVRSYVWGLDLSGTMDGAGGVGGLLWVTLHTGFGAAPGTHFCAYDGNGNIVALSAASDGLETARYEYGPFAEPIRITGPAAPLNPFRFSTKRTCNTTDLVLYEYRVYKPSIGRWANRDPIEEEGGLNLYAYVGNDPVNEFDPLGLLAGAPLPAPPPTLPPPIGTPKPGPPIVTICTVAFCVVYTCTAYACEKTGVHDKLGDLIYKCRNRKSALEKCKDDCYDSYLSDVAFCKGVRTKRQREYRYRQAFKLYVDCLKGCEKEHGGR